MRAFIDWRGEWVLGIPEVDKEHRELVALFNRIGERFYGTHTEHCVPEAPDECVDCVAILDMLEDFGQHVRAHFKYEESLMRDTDFPEFDAHCYDHATLLAEYTVLLRELRNKGLECLDVGALLELKSWLVGHIASADMSFGEYYQTLAQGAGVGSEDGAVPKHQIGRNAYNASMKASGASL